MKPRLPKLSLPKFRDDVTKWQSFWYSFKSAIHENSDISTIDKFNHLNSLLEGNAARTVQGLTLTSSNYNAAVEMLQERYGKPQIIISAHMDEILKIQPCMEGGRLGPLRYVYDKISVHVRGLASMGVSSKEYGSLLIPIIMSKLPSDVRLQISRKSTNEVWKIDELLDTIKSEIDAREASEGTPWSQRAPKSLKFVLLTVGAYTIPLLVTRSSTVKAERRFLRAATDPSIVYKRDTTTVSV